MSATHPPAGTLLQLTLQLDADDPPTEVAGRHQGEARAAERVEPKSPDCENVSTSCSSCATGFWVARRWLPG